MRVMIAILLAGVGAAGCGEPRVMECFLSASCSAPWDGSWGGSWGEGTIVEVCGEEAAEEWAREVCSAPMPAFCDGPGERITSGPSCLCKPSAVKDTCRAEDEGKRTVLLDRWDWEGD